MWELTEKYAWADEDENLAWTVAVIDGFDADEVIRIYGGDPAQPLGQWTFDDAWVPEDDFGEYFYVQVITHDGYVVAIEPNGWTGKVAEIARRASADGGRFFSVYWNADGRWYIVQAINGAVTGSFDVALRYPTDLLPAWAVEVDFSTNNLGALCLALMEQQTGLVFDPAWLRDKLPTYRIPDPDVMLRDVDGARQP